MLACRTCLLRCIEALGSPVSASPSTRRTLRLRRNAASAFTLSQQRSLRTKPPQITPEVHKYAQTRYDEVEALARSEDEPWKKSRRAAILRKKVRTGRTRHPTSAARKFAGLSKAEGEGEGALDRLLAYVTDESGGRRRKSGEEDAQGPSKHRDMAVERRIGRRDPSMSSVDWNRRKKELQYLTDPLELAKFVKKELRKDKSKEMLQLVQMASHSMQAIVSWNHLIDYHLAKGNVSKAMKIYNDMKRRAQFPDSYTYTIIFRGMATNANDSGALARALSVYHSMFAPNSRVTPSILHTNAMLKVCARAMDMDALWGVAAKIPETGRGAANAITYATILSAIRQSLIVGAPRGETEEQVATRRECGIAEARRIWEDVITKWRNADMAIDEELVCTMGRLLLIGSRPRDWDDVLSLVEQTMDIPRLVPRLGTRERIEAGYPHLRATQVLKQLRFADDHMSPHKDAAVRGDEFLALSPKGALSKHLTFATPSNNTLSMIQEACQKIAATRASHEYWDLLTDPGTYAIEPDANNMNQRLRILRQQRASEEAVKLLQKGFIAKGLVPRPGTLRIVMSTCARDKNNHNSLRHGSMVLEIMLDTLPDVDPRTVAIYAGLASAFPLAKSNDLVDALTYLRPCVRSLRVQLDIGTVSGERKEFKKDRTLTGDEWKDAISALRQVYGLFDKLINSDLLAEEDKRPFKKERAVLAAFLNREAFREKMRSARAGKRDKDESAESGDGEPGGKRADGAEGEDVGVEENSSVLGYLRKTSSWRERMAIPPEKRRPWFSPGEV